MGGTVNLYQDGGEGARVKAQGAPLPCKWLRLLPCTDFGAPKEQPSRARPLRACGCLLTSALPPPAPPPPVTDCLRCPVTDCLRCPVQILEPQKSSQAGHDHSGPVAEQHEMLRK